MPLPATVPQIWVQIKCVVDKRYSYFIWFECINTISRGLSMIFDTL